MATNHINGPKEPFGYKLTDNGLEPIEEQLKALDKAKWYIANGCTMKATRDWLEKKTGRYISTAGLLKAIKYDPSIRYSN